MQFRVDSAVRKVDIAHRSHVTVNNGCMNLVRDHMLSVSLRARELAQLGCMKQSTTDHTKCTINDTATDRLVIALKGGKTVLCDHYLQQIWTR